MAASVMTKTFLPLLERGLGECGFRRRGRILFRTSGPLHGVIEILNHRSLDPAVKKFRIEWAVVPERMMSALSGGEPGSTSLSALVGMKGAPLVPPSRHYGAARKLSSP